MKIQLKKITDVTINSLLNKDVIMPSIYFESFNKNAKTFNIDVKDSSFEKELNKILIEDFNSIERYMWSIEKSAYVIKDAVEDTQKALLHKDIDTLTNIYTQMQKLEKEVEELNKKLFVDDLTLCNNRKWVYNKFLNDEAQFKSNGICILIDIKDFNYVQNEYGIVLANNLIMFISNFIKEKLKEENISFNMARFFDNQFFIFINKEKKKEISDLFFNIKQLIKETTLKSKTGLAIKANYNYEISEYIANEESKKVFETLFHQINEK